MNNSRSKYTLAAAAMIAGLTSAVAFADSVPVSAIAQSAAFLAWMPSSTFVNLDKVLEQNYRVLDIAVPSNVRGQCSSSSSEIVVENMNERIVVYARSKDGYNGGMDFYGKKTVKLICTETKIEGATFPASNLNHPHA